MGYKSKHIQFSSYKLTNSGGLSKKKKKTNSGGENPGGYVGSVN